MNYVVFGVNHKTAPLKVREQMASCEVPIFLEDLKKQDHLRESVVLSTCNRFEIYGVFDKVWETQNFLKKFFGKDLSKGQYYHLQDCDVVTHLFSVVSSLDSLVVGENQIVNQVKEAYTLARLKETTGPYLNRLFHRALFVAKRVRTETGVGEGQVSVGSIAVKMAEKIFGSLHGKTVVLFGAGQVGELVLKNLSGETKIFLVNRNFEKAEKLASQGLGEACPFDRLPEVLSEADVFLSAVSHFEGFSKKDFANIMAKRKSRPLFAIDLSVPRSLPEDIGSLNNLYLYNIDDLEVLAKDNQRQRQKHVDCAKTIVEKEAEAFYRLSFDAGLETAAKLGQKFEFLRQKELQKSLVRLGHLRKEDQDAIEALTKSLVGKILHDPIVLLRQESQVQEKGFIENLKKIFRLDDEEEYES